MSDKKKLSERDICTQHITPALQRAGWDFSTQVREEVTFTKGRVIVRGKLHTRGKQKRADYILYYAPNLPIAVIEAKDNTHMFGNQNTVSQPKTPKWRTTVERLKERFPHFGDA